MGQSGLAGDIGLRAASTAGSAGSAARRRWGVLLAVWVAVQIAVAWAPFRLDPPRLVENAAQRLTDGTLAFDGERAVAVAGPPAWLYEGVGNDPLVLDLELRADRTHQVGPARILALSADHWNGNLVVGQDGSDLEVRVRRPHSGPAGQPPFTVPGVFAEPRWQRLRVLLADDRVSVDVDGERRLDERSPPGNFRRWDASYRLALGDELVGERLWRGQIAAARVTVGGRTVDYAEPGNLRVPARAWVVPSRLRDAAGAPSRAAQRRSLLHLVAFSGVGGLLVLTRGRQVPLLRLAAAIAAASVVLQLGKVAVEARHPSVLTVAAHVAGAVIGAWVVGRFVSGRAPAARP